MRDLHILIELQVDALQLGNFPQAEIQGNCGAHLVSFLSGTIAHLHGHFLLDI